MKLSLKENVMRIFLPLLICMAFLTGCKKDDAKNVTWALANNLADSLWEKNIGPTNEVVEQVMPKCIDPWGRPYIARMKSTKSRFQVEVFSRGSNGMTDAPVMIMVGINAGDVVRGDDIIAHAYRNRKGYLLHVIKNGSSAAAEGVVEGVSEGATNGAKKIGKAIRDITKNARGDE